MPLRDHFRPPVSKQSSWEGFHAMWPASIVRHLRQLLPPGCVAEPRVHLGTLMEIDVGAVQSTDKPRLEVSWIWGQTSWIWGQTLDLGSDLTLDLGSDLLGSGVTWIWGQT
jgi:hypothetical protein